MLLGCASAPTAPTSPTAERQREVVLAPGGSARLADTDLTLVFDTVVEDSRCPAGVECVWEGDAAVQIHITSPGASLSSYTLHTSDRFPRQIDHGSVRVRLVAVNPQPVVDVVIRPDEYRVTILVERP